MTRSSAVRPDGGDPVADGPSPPTAQLSTSELVRLASTQLSELVHDEIRLARAELRQKSRRAGLAVVLLAVAALLAAYGLGVLLFAGVLGLAQVLPVWLAALLVGVALVVLAALTAWAGRHRLRRSGPPYPQQAMTSVRADARLLAAKARR